jgi:hypothetical protein
VNPYQEMDREQLLSALAIFATFARTVDSRIRTRCLHCPPDAPEGKYCAWEFSVGDDDAEESQR